MIMNLFYIVISFLISSNVIFGVNYLHSEKSIKNLKNKSEILIEDENFELALNIYLKILEIEQTIYSENSFELASTYDKIAELYIKLENYSDALPYIQKSISIYQENILRPLVNSCNVCFGIEDFLYNIKKKT